MTSLAKIEAALGTEAKSLLEHESKTVPKSLLHLPSPRLCRPHHVSE
jgi:hypothetical protein